MEYVIEAFSSGTDFGPGTKIAEIWDARSIGWSAYDRVAGKAFFTLPQSSPTLPLLAPLTTHIRITRLSSSGEQVVWSGMFVDYSATGDDVVCDCFDYISLLGVSRTGYRTMYPVKALGSEIVSPEWTLAKGATSSPLAFVTTGTIEDPVGTDGTTVIKTNNTFGLLDQMRLQLFYDLSEMGRANTAYNVSFEITRTAPHTFNFWRNKGSASGVGFILNGTVSDYQYLPNWSSYRNDLATLGTTVGGGATEIVKTDATSAATYGLRQDVFTIKTVLGVVGAATESDQQVAVTERMLKSRTQARPALLLKLHRATLGPFEGHDINDTAVVEVANGIDTITGRWRIIGERVLFTDAGEDLSIIVTRVLT